MGDFDKVVVSTDSKKVKWCVEKYGSGVEVIDRPKKLASNNAHVMDTMQYHLKEMAKRGETYDYVMMHHATAPMVDRFDVHKAINFMLTKDADFVISMCKSEMPHGIALPVPADGLVKGWYPKDIRCKNRQELSHPYQLDNNIYIGKWDIFYHNVDYWNTNIYAFKMPKGKCADIDTEEGFTWAELMFKRVLKADRANYGGQILCGGEDIDAKG